MKVIILSVILFVGCLSAKETCLDLKPSDNEMSDRCLHSGENLSQNDLEILTIICKLSRGIFPFQPRKSISKTQKDSWNKYSGGLPHFQLMMNNQYKFNIDFNFQDCEEAIKSQAAYFFWAPKSEVNVRSYKVMAREYSKDDTERNNTSIGILEKKIGQNITFTPSHRSDYLNQPKEPLSFDFLVFRPPIKQVFNVTNVESSVETILEPKKYLSYFSYYNPSEYEQVIEVFLDSKYSVAYSFKEHESIYLVQIEINDEDNYIKRTNRAFNEFESVSKNVAFNISIPAYSAITARIVGKAVYVESNVLATKRDHFSTSENNEPISEAKGMKKEFYVTDFHLEDVQMHHTSEVLVVNYTTIYVALLCLGVVLLAGLLVFIVRLAIKRFRTPTVVPYQSLAADS